MLEVKNISKSFGAKKALDNVNFSIKKGQIAALLGENGAGKSTLLRILSGFYEADSGSISLDKIDLKLLCIKSAMYRKFRHSTAK